jgi:hypothetical protein
MLLQISNNVLFCAFLNYPLKTFPVQKILRFITKNKLWFCNSTKYNSQITEISGNFFESTI